MVFVFNFCNQFFENLQTFLLFKCVQRKFVKVQLNSCLTIFNSSNYKGIKIILGFRFNSSISKQQNKVGQNSQIFLKFLTYLNASFVFRSSSFWSFFNVKKVQKKSSFLIPKPRGPLIIKCRQKILNSQVNRLQTKSVCFVFIALFLYFLVKHLNKFSNLFFSMFQQNVSIQNQQNFIQVNHVCNFVCPGVRSVFTNITKAQLLFNVIQNKFFLLNYNKTQLAITTCNRKRTITFNKSNKPFQKRAFYSISISISSIIFKVNKTKTIIYLIIFYAFTICSCVKLLKQVNFTQQVKKTGSKNKC